MFNTTIHRHESKVVAVTKEIEKTISPDKVTEMYDAVREEVEDSIVRKFSIRDNVLSAIVVEIAPKYDSRENLFLIRFTLNGKEYISRKKLPIRATQLATYDEVLNFYRECVVEHLIKQTDRHLLTEIK